MRSEAPPLVHCREEHSAMLVFMIWESCMLWLLADGFAYRVGCEEDCPSVTCLTLS